MRISRINPLSSEEYIDPDFFVRSGVSSVVVADNTLHISGLTPIRERNGQRSIVGENSTEKQLQHILELLETTLIEAGSDKANLLSLTVYSKDHNQFAESLPILAEWTGADRPACTAVGVAELAHPEQLLEISAIARKVV